MRGTVSVKTRTRPKDAKSGHNPTRIRPKGARSGNSRSRIRPRAARSGRIPPRGADVEIKPSWSYAYVLDAARFAAQALDAGRRARADRTPDCAGIVRVRRKGSALGDRGVAERLHADQTVAEDERVDPVVDLGLGRVGLPFE